MRKSLWIIALLFAAIVAPNTRAQVTACVSATATTYVGLGTVGCTIGSYNFYNFSYSASETGGVSLPSTDAITVVPLLNDTTDRGGASITGLGLEGNWDLNSGQTLSINFQLSIAPLTGATNTFTFLLGYMGSNNPSTFTNLALLSEGYSVLDQNGLVDSFPLTPEFSHQTCTSCTGSGFAVPVTNVHFASGTQDFTYEAGSGSMEYDGFVAGVQTYVSTPPSPTPEPATGGLMLLGFGMMVRKRYTQWRQRATQTNHS